MHVVGASRGAADDLVRSLASRSGATIGLHRFSLTHLAVRLAAPALAADGYALSTYLGSEAVAARAAFDAQQDGALPYFDPVARTPGFARALARTLQELRLARVDASSLAGLPLGGPDLAALLERFERFFASATARDRATLFTVATTVVEAGGAPGFDLSAPLLLLDVPLDTRVEFELARALMRASRAVLVTVPFGDIAALNRLEEMGLKPEVLVQTGEADLVALRRYMFAGSKLRPRTPAGDVRFFSAPGEGRECVEIVRRILDEVRRGVPFDEIAVFVRSPERYGSLLEHAVRRAVSVEAGDAGGHRPRGRRRQRAAGLLRTRHAPSASGRPRVPGDPRVRVREALGPPVRRVSLARAGAAARRHPAQLRGGDPRRRDAGRPA